ncbi:GspE/PulE family protein [Clostridium carnis]
MNNKNYINEVDLNVARKVNINQAKTKKFLPIKVIDENIVIIAKEENRANFEEIKFIYNKNIIVDICTEDYIYSMIDKVFLGESENLVNDILENAIKYNSSDIHFEPGKKDVIIRFRIDGVLILQYKVTHNEYNILLSKIKIESNMDITEKRRPQDGKYTIRLDKKNYDLRISTLPTFYGEKLVVRILYGTVFNYSLKSLNLTQYQYEKIKKIISRKHGLTIINGPTGSGKSTTLYTILQEINNMDINITTIEDPVEILIEGINQVSLNRKVDIDFANGLRSILRQDPDAMMIGEIRDEETAQMAVRASLTGHKVYSTIHTKTPRDVYLRLEDMGVKDYLLKDSLIGIISQRLIKVLCEKCKKEIGNFIFKGETLKKYKKCGCSYCNYTGYKGRSIVCAIYYLDNDKEFISNIFQEINLLNNSEMIDNLDLLLKSGSITTEDYNEFLQMEGVEEVENKKGIS